MTARNVDASQQLPVAYPATPIYTAPLTVSSAIIFFGVCNNITSSDVTLTMERTDVGVAVGSGLELISARTIIKASPDPLDEFTGVVLGPGDFVSAKASVAASLNLVLSIKEIT